MRVPARFFVLPLSILTLLSCESPQHSKRKVGQHEKETTAVQAEPQPIAEPRSTVKYMYVVITTNEPKILSKLSEDRSSSSSRRSESSGSNPFVDLPQEVAPLEDPKYYKYARPQYFTYTSDIIEITDYTEDKKELEADKFEKAIQPNLADANRRIELENATTMGDYVSAEAEITSVKSYVFDSYREASRRRAKERHIER